MYLSCDNKYVGAFLFGTGLFVILCFGFNLFTGKVGYAVENKPAYIIDLLVIWLGNLIGTSAMGAMLLFTRISGIGGKAAEMCAVKLSDGVVSILILSFFCGMRVRALRGEYVLFYNRRGMVGKGFRVLAPDVTRQCGGRYVYSVCEKRFY